MDTDRNKDKEGERECRKGREEEWVRNLDVRGLGEREKVIMGDEEKKMRRKGKMGRETQRTERRHKIEKM